MMLYNSIYLTFVKWWEIIEMGNRIMLPGMRNSWGCGDESDYQEAAQRKASWWQNSSNPDYFNFLVWILYYNYVRWNHWGKWPDIYLGLLSIALASPGLNLCRLLSLLQSPKLDDFFICCYRELIGIPC